MLGKIIVLSDQYSIYTNDRLLFSIAQVVIMHLSPGLRQEVRIILTVVMSQKLLKSTVCAEQKPKLPTVAIIL